MASKKSIIQLLVAAVITAVIVVPPLLDKFRDKGDLPVASTQDPIVVIPEGQEILQVSIDQLIEDYRDEDETADLIYENQWLELSGISYGLSTMSRGNSKSQHLVIIRDDDMPGSVWCSFDEPIYENADFDLLTEITVIGEFTGYSSLLDNGFLSHCSPISNELDNEINTRPKPQPNQT